MTLASVGKPHRQTLDWTTNADLAAGKGATVQEFSAVVGNQRYVIDAAPWGEGRFTVDGREIARVDSAKDSRQAFSKLSSLAERYRKREPIEIDIPRRSPLIPAAKEKLLAGKRGLIIGIANENSIAWGCARAFRALGTAEREGTAVPRRPDADPRAVLALTEKLPQNVERASNLTGTVDAASAPPRPARRPLLRFALESPAKDVPEGRCLEAA